MAKLNLNNNKNNNSKKTLDIGKLNLNLTGNSSNEDENENIDYSYSQEEQNIDEEERRFYKQKCLEIEQELINNMEDNAIEVNISSSDEENARKRYKKLKRKKLIFYIVIIMMFVGVNIFAFYKVFFEHKFTGKEIAALSNYYNKQTNFPENGVQGFINSNIDKILYNKISLGKTISDFDITESVVTKINKKNDELANVYFYVTLVTDGGTEKLNCVVPIFWDEENSQYAFGGNVIFTPNKAPNENDKLKENYMLSFDGIPKEKDEKTKSSQSFVNNFFTLLYTGQDVSQYYNGIAELNGSDGIDLQYIGMSEYTLYTTKNKNGYNAFCTITLTTSNGLTYTTDKYITIEGDDKNWIITAIL